MDWRKLAAAILVFLSAAKSYAGGPAFVAGSGYDPGIEGQAVLWANGSVQYFTDQGDLSPTLTGAQADALVASAFNTWTAIPGVALTASQSGHLAEDVTGANIVIASNGTITAPSDITPLATGTPVGVVYDYDGTVTDALLGEGAGDEADCFTNAVYGGPDNFSSSAYIVHALVVINGNCATSATQLPDVQYRLVRVLGRLIGLGWSQANVNVLTRNPVPVNGDYAGFPVMHFADPISCVPITVCYPQAGVPVMDDIASLARLYPAASSQQSTGTVYGSVYFTDEAGDALQLMQGVNVVARLMVSGLPSRQFVVTSVSGFTFRGNAGNIIDGYVDGNGLRYDRFGSDDPTLEGSFDLGQLTIPAGQNVAQYQLSVEGLDPDWSEGVEPYGPTQVTPSGTFAPVVVTVTAGSNAERDILMLQTEIAQPHPGSGSTYANPAALPQGGAWGSWISGYGSVDYFEFNAQANRTASIAVTALDENGQPTETKLLPVIGIWQLSDGTGDPAPAFTPSAFNSTTFAMTRLDAQFGVSDTFRVAVADYRGDGRPDYFYQAKLLYSDTVTPARISLAGGVTTLAGTGFNPGLQVTANGVGASVLSTSAKQIQVTMPPGPQDGTVTVQVMDPSTGGFSQMISALTYGAQSTDELLMLQNLEPSTPIGSVAANPIRVRAVAADGITPVKGATIAWSATKGLQFSVCAGGTSCSVLSDESGESSSNVTPTATGASTITIALAPGSYSPPATKQTTVVAISSTLDLSAMSPNRWIAQGATIAIPLAIEALNSGTPAANVAVNFQLTQGTALLSAGTATTNASGMASVTANLTNQNGSVQVAACVAQNGAPCQTFQLYSTPPSLWSLQAASGSLQVVPIGQSFQPLVMRVTDGSAAANPVMGVSVTFATTLARVGTDQAGNQIGEKTGEPGTGGDSVPILLGSSQVQVLTDSGGLASMVPSVGSVGPCEVLVTVNAGSSTLPFEMESVAAIVPAQPEVVHVNSSVPLAPPRFGGGAIVTPNVQTDILAVPEGDPGIQPIADSQASTCSESVTDDVPGAINTELTAPANDLSLSAACSQTPPSNVDPPQVDPSPVGDTESNSPQKDPPQINAAQSPTSSSTDPPNH